jgi:hypothetical protein
MDKEGNFYISGHFERFTRIGNYSLTSKGATDAFIAKYDPEGNNLWLQQITGVGPNTINNFILDSMMNLYLSGLFEKSTTLGLLNLNDKGSLDIFLAKLGESNSISENAFVLIRDGDWSDPNNWLNNSVPTDKDDVIISANIISEIKNGFEAHCKNLYIEQIGRLRILPGSKLNVQGKLQNRGILQNYGVLNIAE